MFLLAFTRRETLGSTSESMNSHWAAPRLWNSFSTSRCVFITVNLSDTRFSHCQPTLQFECPLSSVTMRLAQRPRLSNLFGLPLTFQRGDPGRSAVDLEKNLSVWWLKGLLNDTISVSHIGNFLHVWEPFQVQSVSPDRRERIIFPTDGVLGEACGEKCFRRDLLKMDFFWSRKK